MKDGIQFPETSPVTLEYFLYWLHHGEIAFAELDMSNTSMDKEPYYPVIGLWIFANRYNLPKLQNIAMSRLYVCKQYRALTPSLISDFLRVIPTGSILERFLAREMALTWTAADMSQYEALWTVAQEEVRKSFESDKPDPLTLWPMSEFKVEVNNWEANVRAWVRHKQ